MTTSRAGAGDLRLLDGILTRLAPRSWRRRRRAYLLLLSLVAASRR
jgi:hypothetical protein